MIKRQDSLEKMVTTKSNDHLKKEFDELIQFYNQLSSEFKILSSDMQVKFYELFQKLDTLNDKNYDDEDVDDYDDDEDGDDKVDYYDRNYNSNTLQGNI